MTDASKKNPTRKSKESKKQVDCKETDQGTIDDIYLSLKKTDFKELDGKLLHIQVGDSSWGSETLNSELLQKEIKYVENQILSLMNNNDINCLVWVTHPFIKINIIESMSKKD